MTGKIFFDTNVLVYAFDSSEKAKHETCKSIVLSVFKGVSLGVISNQVLSEFFVIVTKKIRKPLDVSFAKNLASAFVFCASWEKANYDYTAVMRAMELVQIHGASYWDCLIAATMERAGVFTIYTENTKDFKRFENIKAINPFSEG